MAAFSIHHRSSLLYTCSQLSTNMPVLNTIICWTPLPSVGAFLLWPQLVWFRDLGSVLSLEGRGVARHWVHSGRLPLEGSRAPERVCLSERVLQPEMILQPERVLLPGTVKEMQRGQPAQNKKKKHKWRKREPKHWLCLENTCFHVHFKCVFLITVQNCIINYWICTSIHIFNIYTIFTEINQFFECILHLCMYFVHVLNI